MEENQNIVFREKAKLAIRDIAVYIELNGYPETAEKFVEKLLSFGSSLAVFPNKYPLCKQPQFAKRRMHCAVFHKNYVFVYRLVKNSLVIYNIIHTNTNPAFHTVS